MHPQDALRAAHERMTGVSGDWITPTGSFVYVPDGLEPEWCDAAARLAGALHEAERAGDVERARVLRVEATKVVAAALPRSRGVAGSRMAVVVAGVSNLTPKVVVARLGA